MNASTSPASRMGAPKEQLLLDVLSAFNRGNWSQARQRAAECAARQFLLSRVDKMLLAVAIWSGTDQSPNQDARDKSLADSLWLDATAGLPRRLHGMALGYSVRLVECFIGSGDYLRARFTLQEVVTYVGLDPADRLRHNDLVRRLEHLTGKCHSDLYV